jgi:hypothetical protein
MSIPWLASRDYTYSNERNQRGTVATPILRLCLQGIFTHKYYDDILSKWQSNDLFELEYNSASYIWKIFAQISKTVNIKSFKVAP